MAEVTERVEIGCLVAANSYRNPNLLADMARTLDHISGGRFILGIGSGWNQRDYEEYGYEFGTAASRLRDLDRDMPVIVDRLRQAEPAPGPEPVPDPDRRRRRKGDPAHRRPVRHHLERPGRAGRARRARTGSSTSGAPRSAAIPAEIERSAQIFGPQLDRLDEYLAAGITHFIADAGRSGLRPRAAPQAHRLARPAGESIDRDRPLPPPP